MGRPEIATRSSPRISANDLARYMVSSDTARMGIIRRAKHPTTPPLIRYKEVRQPLISYLSDGNRRVNPLVTAEEMLKQRATDRSTSALRQDDALKSIEVLHAAQGMANRLAEYDFHPAQDSRHPLVIEGVEVSLRADLIVHGTAKGKEQIGTAMFRMTQDDAETDEAKEKRRDMGLYVATLLLRQIERFPISNRHPTARLCMSIDIQHGEIFVAPASNARRMSDIENACLMVAAVWDRA
jgi:hypothetical protein